MIDTLELLHRVLIDTRDESLGAYRLPYLAFNALEACCWFACAVKVGVRFARLRRSRLELLYALAFAAFGLTDVIELGGTTLLLLLAKGNGLLALIGLRRAVLLPHPGARW